MDRPVLVLLQLLPLLIVGGVFVSTLRLGHRRVPLRPSTPPAPGPGTGTVHPGPADEY